MALHQTVEYGISGSSWSECKWKTGILNETEEMACWLSHPAFRRREHQLPWEKEDCIGRWLVCTPEMWKSFQFGFIFGRKLYKELQMPVGLIQSTWEVPMPESWTERRWWKTILCMPMSWKSLPQNVKREKDKCKYCWRCGTVWLPRSKDIPLWNIWYQESPIQSVLKYQKVFTNLINSWRQEWGRPICLLFRTDCTAQQTTGRYSWRSIENLKSGFEE